jgi:hypothetical protein
VERVHCFERSNEDHDLDVRYNDHMG